MAGSGGCNWSGADRPSREGRPVNRWIKLRMMRDCQIRSNFVRECVR